MIVLRDRVDQVRRHRANRKRRHIARPIAISIEVERAFLDAPAVVAALRDDVDFLDVVLADVAEVERAIPFVEREAVRIAQAIGVNFVNARHSHKRVISRNTVLPVHRIAGIDVDAKDFAQHVVQ